MLSGYADWRLPSYIELISLVDYGAAIPFKNASLNATYFPGTPQDYFWSSTRFAAKPTVETPAAWFVAFTTGWTQQDILTDMNWARCVRGTSDAGAPSCRYVAPGDGTVNDTMTGLIWQQAVATADGGGLDWPTAMQYCATLTLGGRNPWRLPTIKELLTLLAVTIDTIATMSFGTDAHVFPSPLTGGLWSSTLEPDTMRRFGLGFGGTADSSDTTVGLNARCVR
jgi:hypothetical protein